MKSVKKLLVLLLLATAGYLAMRYYYAPVPLDKRTVITQSVEQVKKGKALSGEEEDLLRLQLALSDYQIARGNPPDSLLDLVPVYFDQLPKDPTTQEVYKYERLGARYRLGSQVGQPELKPGEKAKKKINEKGPAAAVAFVNPNEMSADPFVYDSASKRDPFEPFDLAPKVATSGPLTPLQQYDIGQLRLTAVLQDASGQPVALVENAAGQGFTVKAKTKIGTRGGEVVSVEADRLKILETAVDFTGVEKQTVVEMKIEQGGTRKNKKKKRD